MSGCGGDAFCDIGSWYLSLIWVYKNGLDTQNKKKATLYVFTGPLSFEKAGMVFLPRHFTHLITEPTGSVTEDEEINTIGLTLCRRRWSLLRLSFITLIRITETEAWKPLPFFPTPRHSEWFSVNPNSFLFLHMWTFSINLFWCMFLFHEPRVICQVFYSSLLWQWTKMTEQ